MQRAFLFLLLLIPGLSYGQLGNLPNLIAAVPAGPDLLPMWDSDALAVRNVTMDSLAAFVLRNAVEGNTETNITVTWQNDNTLDFVLDDLSSIYQVDLDVPSQAEAEAGTATNERVWTAERIGQAIAALSSLVTGSDGQLVRMSGTDAVGEDSLVWGAGLAIVGGLTTTGNVGIGTTSPAVSLQVHGAVRALGNSFDANTDGAGYRFGAGDAEITHSAYDMVFSNYNGSSMEESMRITGDGNVGIGTASPSADLDVGGGTATSIDGAGDLLVADDVEVNGSIYVADTLGIGTTSLSAPLTVRNGSANSYGLHIEASDAGNLFDVFEDSGGNGRMFLRNEAASIRVAIVSSGNSYFNGGNVGIGTNSPDRILHAEVDDASNAAVTQALRLTHTTSGTPVAGIGVGLEFEAETAASNNEVIARIEAVTTDVTATAENAALDFYTMDGGSISQKMHLSSEGDLGIGTSAPQEDLHIDSGAEDQTDIFLTHSTSGSIFGSDGANLTLVGSDLFVTNREAGTINLQIEATTRFQATTTGVDITGNLTASGNFRRSTTAGITASTTQTQAGATALTAEINEVSTVANTNDAVRLITAAAGICQIVLNNGANTLQIFPASGDDLGAGLNTSTTLASGSNIRYCAYDATNWESY